MAYLKFARDKRGYEHFYLVQPSNRGKARPRVLYWFRTPPGIKVGRLPFDPDMRRALETQNPDVFFDWEAIANTPIPPLVEPERWRERRRVERAFRDTEEAASIQDVGEPPPRSETPAIDPVVVGPSAIEEEPSAIEIAELTATAEPVAIEGLPGGPPADGGQAGASGQAREHRQEHQGRRRRRRRGRRNPQVQGSGFTVQGSQVPEPEKATSEEPAIQDSGEPEE